METPLHRSILNADEQGVTKAISEGYNLNELDDLGNSALHWAVMRGDDHIVKILLEAGANPNIMNSDGYTLKWSAADFGLTEIADLLTQHGGRINTNEDFDKTSWSVFKGFLGEDMPEEE